MRMTAVLAGPPDHRHPYLRRMLIELRCLGHAVTAIDMAAIGTAESDRWLEAVTAEDILVIDSSATPALRHVANRHGSGRAALFVREASPTGEIGALLPNFGPVIVTSEAARQALGAELALPMERVRVVEPGVDPDLPRSHGPAVADGCAILAVDPVWPRSDHAALLRALARLADLDWTLTVAANSAAWTMQAAEFGIAGRLHVLAPDDASGVEQAWRDAGLYVLVSDADGDGLAVCEALRRGLPVAVAGGPAMRVRVPGSAGVIAGPGDHAALSTAMRRLIFDAPLRREMSEAAWELGRTLPSWEAQARRFAKALED